MTKRHRLYEGKAKILYQGPEPGTIIQHFKDSVTAFNREKEEVIEGKGVLANRISEYIFIRLHDMNIPNHFIRRLNMREQLVRALEIIPIEVVVRNVIAGSLVKRSGLAEGTTLARPIVEYYYKDDALGDPMVTEDHITTFDWARANEFDEMTHLALRINDYLCGLFAGINIRLVDFKIEFGRLWENQNHNEDAPATILLADEFSPDNCRLWDMTDGERLDKDRFRQDLGGLLDAYQEVARRFNISVRLPAKNDQPSGTTPRLVKG